MNNHRPSVKHGLLLKFRLLVHEWGSKIKSNTFVVLLAKGRATSLTWSLLILKSTHLQREDVRQENLPWSFSLHYDLHPALVEITGLVRTWRQLSHCKLPAACYCRLTSPFARDQKFSWVRRESHWAYDLITAFMSSFVSCWCSQAGFIKRGAKRRSCCGGSLDLYCLNTLLAPYDFSVRSRFQYSPVFRNPVARRAQRLICLITDQVRSKESITNLKNTASWDVSQNAPPCYPIINSSWVWYTFQDLVKCLAAFQWDANDEILKSGYTHILRKNRVRFWSYCNWTRAPRLFKRHLIWDERKRAVVSRYVICNYSATARERFDRCVQP
jgi:hypothetical protein